ncbi:hypothetical protein [Hydrogenophaga sp.]|uniref:hypothetical protein n=1 Tax=Hydrogenophaga sp. TaxID=1904254 RepID=UPI002731FB8F|nr:hypothetical protein [Hydrogenophaga sp.]MDP2017819.1 hypothetical protein [Hydrogenophaga sp.]MDP3164813.1 hypothetical protein [Hydrogenophaga sp.]MDP3813347.1 hypothetical protein [Hydrogenophaga sp.]
MSESIGTVSANVLLIEPDGLVRGAVASVCRELEIVRMHQATSLVLGEQWLTTYAADGLLLSLAEGEVALELLGRLRAGDFRSEPGIPVAVMAQTCDAALLIRLKELDVRRFILQPFKLRDVVHTVEQLWPVKASAPA